MPRFKRINFFIIIGPKNILFLQKKKLKIIELSHCKLSGSAPVTLLLFNTLKKMKQPTTATILKC